MAEDLIMTPITLQALRRLLFFTQPEAATLIGQVTERSWRFWEDGQRTIPVDVIERIQQLVSWRMTALQTASDAITDGMANAPENTEPPRLIWYNTVEDWMTMPDREPVLWRPHCSVIAELCARHHAIAVPFNAPNYSRWLAGRKDSEAMRGQWAGS